MRVIKNLISAVLLCASLALYAAAEVTTVEEAAEEAGVVYVTGNPDFYPVEFYDGETEEFAGIMPTLLERFSEKYGVDFVYLRGGEEDYRWQMAENCQTELLSGCRGDEPLPEGVSKGETILHVTVEGREVPVFFGYTGIATARLRTELEEYLASISPQELTNLTATVSMETGRKPVPYWTMVLLISFFVLLAAGAAVIVLLIRQLRKKAEDDLLTDPTTGAGNRQYFLTQFQSSVTEETRALWYIFSFGFDVNQVTLSRGEGECDNLLRYIANLLLRHVDEHGFFGRTSNGSFTSACQFLSRDKAEAWVGEMLSLMNDYGKDSGTDCAPAICAGVYSLKDSRDDSLSGESAIFSAQQGCLYAASHGLPYFFTDDITFRAEREKAELRGQAAEAVKNREFRCYIQLIRDVKTDSFCGGEVLSRWLHPQRGLLMPGRYIAEMEENGTIEALDYYMLTETCRLLEQLHRDGMGNFTLYCNVSLHTFALPDFGERVRIMLKNYSFSHDKLCLEVTEGKHGGADVAVNENLQKCRQAGVRIAIDNVGSGVSSFGGMVHSPADVVKINRDLLLEAVNEDGRRLLAGINALFHSIGVKTLCGGVEIGEQYELIREIGIDLAQGYYIRHPLPAKEAVAALTGQR